MNTHNAFASQLSIGINTLQYVHSYLKIPFLAAVRLLLRVSIFEKVVIFVIVEEPEN